MNGKFGDYTLNDALGSGDMGTVYRAQPRDGGQPVALKILDKVDTASAMKRGGAVELMEFAATLTHPRLQPIRAILDDPEGDGRLGLVMDYAPLGSIGSLSAAGKAIPPKLGLKIVGQLAAALSFLHGQEVAHGSIKPNNVLLLDGEGNATLTDLSMAHLRELGFIPPNGITEQHQYFMQPERMYHSTPTIEGDVFSLAVLAYFLLTGRIPFDNPEPEARGIVPALNLPPAFAAVLRRAINPHLHQRYRTIEEFMAVLKDASQGRVDPDTEKVFGLKATPPPSDER